MSDLEQRVQKALDKIRPYFWTDYGDIKIVRIEGRRLYLRFTGSCENCSLAELTARSSVAQIVRSEVPEIEEVHFVNVEKSSS